MALAVGAGGVVLDEGDGEEDLFDEFSERAVAEEAAADLFFVFLDVADVTLGDVFGLCFDVGFVDVYGLVHEFHCTRFFLF